MRARAWVLLLPVLALAGCATPTAPPQSTPAFRGTDFPTNALITQRAVLKIRGSEFPLTGYLAISEERDLRLVVTQVFGQVLADVLVLHDGTVKVVQSSRMLRPAWIRRYLAADVQCIFGRPPPGPCPARALSPTEFRIERRIYTLDVRIVQTRLGPQPPELFRGTVTPTT